MDAVISGHGLAQRYGRRWVFRSLDLTVGTGVTALLGPNGAGKTTLLHTLVGLRTSRGGTLSVLGVDMLRRGGPQAVAARVGFLPQTVGFYPRYTVREYLEYAAWLKGISRHEANGKVEAALRRVDLTDQATAKMRTLSGGMLRRAGIAQATVADPDLLVLDEPAAGLDPAQRIELRRTIRELAKTTSVLVSTHAVEDVKHIADTVLVLRQGTIVFTGPVPELELMARPGMDGDTDLERGYLSVLHHRPTEAIR